MGRRPSYAGAGAMMLTMRTRIKPTRSRGLRPRLRAPWRIALVVGALETIASCGFHLEGTAAIGRMPATARLESVEPHSDFFAALEDALRSGGTRVVADDDAAELKILEDTTGQRVLSVSARNIPREYEVYYRITFSLESAEGVLLAPQSLVATRNYTYDETHVLGKSAEEQEVRRAIAADLARQVVRRIAAAPPVPAAPKT